MELILLYILSNKDRYLRFRKFIKDHTITKEISIIINDLEEWYNTTGKEDIDWNNYRVWFLTVRHATYKEDKVNIFNKIFDKLEETKEPEEEDIQNIVQALIERDYATRIADHSLKIAEGEYLPLDQVADMMEEWRTESGKADEIDKMLVSGDFEELITSTLMGSGYDWRLPDHPWP